jgi:large subunit ribosomal protein L13
MVNTYMAKASEVEKKWYVIDAAGKPLGRVAALAASILRGKHRPLYTPNVDTGEYVIVVNAAKALMTGKKFEKKVYYHHTGWIGHLKKVTYKELVERKPIRAMEMAISGMLPHNTLGRSMFNKLHVYADENHENQAQKPVVWEWKD